VLIAGLLNRLFSWRGFLVTTRISYAIYLTQFPIFLFNVGQVRTANYYEFFSTTVSPTADAWKLKDRLFFDPSLSIRSIERLNETPQRNRSPLRVYDSFQLNVGELMCILFLSIILTLLFDMPFQNIKNHLLKKSVSRQERTKTLKAE